MAEQVTARPCASSSAMGRYAIGVVDTTTVMQTMCFAERAVWGGPAVGGPIGADAGKEQENADKHAPESGSTALHRHTGRPRTSAWARFMGESPRAEARRGAAVLSETRPGRA